MSDRLDRLVETRDRLERAMDEASAGVLPQIVAQYRGVLAEIETIEGTTAQKVGDPVDEIAERRRRRAGTA